MPRDLIYFKNSHVAHSETWRAQNTTRAKHDTERARNATHKLLIFIDDW